jgi:putative phage-type endonuclease
LTAKLETYPNEKAWLEARKPAITSTDAAVIAGVGYISPLELWMQKTGRLEDQPDSRRFRFGRWAEKFIAQELEAEAGVKLIEQPPYSLMRSETHPNRIASLDREVEGGGLAEFKTVSQRMADRWKDGPADYAFVQVQHALFVTGYEFALIAAMIGAGEDFLPFRVAPSPDFQAELMEREEAFLKLVQTDTPPPASGAEGDREALAALYPKDKGETIVLDRPDFPAMVEMLRTAKENKKEAEGIIDLCENTIKEAMGEAAYAEIPGLARYSWKTQIREMKAQEARTLTTRVFRELKLEAK